MATGCTAALAISTSAYAQSADAQATPEEPGGEIVVTGIRASIDNALQVKRNDVRVLDGISSEDLGKFPSQNITEAIQRISGVQMSNINGRGATISVRGLGPQYAMTTVNGQTFKTADFTDGFRYDIIQTELASSIEVIKSPTADMDAGGLSGTVNIVTTKPLDYNERKIVLTVKGQNSEYAGGKVTPKISGSYVDQLAGGTLGVYLNVGYQKLQDRADYVWMDRWWTNNINGSTLTPRRLRYRRIDRTTEQLMASGGLQWQPTDNLEVMATGIWARDKTEYDLNQQVFFFNTSGSTPLGTASVTANEVVDGVAVDTTANNLQLENNRQHEDRKLTSQGYTLSAKWTGDNGWTVRGVGNYTRGNTYWREDAVVMGIYVPTANINIADPNNIIFTTGSTNLSDPSIYAPANLYRNDYPSGATRLMSSREVSGQVDISKEVALGPIKTLTLGAKYRDENFNRYVTRHDLYQLKVNGTYPGAQTTIFPTLSSSNINVTNFMNGEFSIPNSWVAPDISAWAAGLKASGLTVSDIYAPEGSFSVNRYMASGYFMGDIDTTIGGMPLRGNIGVRYEHTKQKVNGNVTTGRTDGYTDVQADIGDYTISQNYGNILPSLNLVLEPANNLQVRFAAAKVLVRPIMDSTTPMARTQSYSSSTNTYSINLGQANLKALTADQLDLGVEWYYGRGSAITIAGFYKWIKNGTYSTLVCPSSWQGTALSTNSTGDCVDSSGAIYDITANLNDPSTIKLKGFEVSWNQNFDDLLPVDGFGIMANLTRVYPQKLAIGTGYTVRNLSKVTWNLVPYWENEHFNIRASINHRSGYDQSNADSFFAREDHTVRARTQIDLSGGYSPNDRLSFSAGVINLNNSREEAYKTDPSIWQESSFVGRSYYVSATLKL
ncbi:TonB-dependent receptor [Novosphingobium sp. CF614]|uniref:TonB-dependent receptor n=1 Tax=Novosphingobium sp. CF614 TaxID=1884364 RepID=UPI0021010B55|nr:TonB-dependent receptor [Novosphingobium sp. CF614]